MIERWFPCQEVSDNSEGGWGSGNVERNLFTWFAARPTAQAKAAVITSLLPWPDDESEQRRLQLLVREAMTGRYEKWQELNDEIQEANPAGASVLDPFSGRGMIPLEAARLGLSTFAVDYSPVAVIASELLTDYPFRDWSNEPALPFGVDSRVFKDPTQRLLEDVGAVVREVGKRHEAAMSAFYPTVGGKQPWGYLWAVTLPCQECGRRFPLVGSFELRKPSVKKGRRSLSDVQDAGQSFYIATDLGDGTFRAVVHEGPPQRAPTLINAIGRDGKKLKGKSAICVFCDNVHSLQLHQRLAGEGLGQDAVLVAADIDPIYGKLFRDVTIEELEAVDRASVALEQVEPFSPVLDAVPDEQIPENNGATIRPQLYGARTYGDLMCQRQTLSFVKLARIISDVASSLVPLGCSNEYARALAGYASSVLLRKLRRSTRGATLDTGRDGIHDIYKDQGTVSFSYDFFEAGIGKGPGTWDSLSGSSMATLRSLLAGAKGCPTTVIQGSAIHLPYRNESMAAVVTDPPYDAMVYYSDSSDFFYVWLKRALYSTHPEIGFSADPRGIQEKTDEIIVKQHGVAPGEHRTRDHYDRLIAQAFTEARRVVRDDGVVTIVFGHGEPEVWHRLLKAITEAGLVLTGSWPAKTEAGSHQGKANIVTTLTMCCKPAPLNRQAGRANLVEAEVRREVKDRVPSWESAGLAPTDQLMASAGPAMEVVGRYGSVLNSLGEPVEPDRYLLIARRAVEEAAAIEIDHLPLETFDPRTRFALSWVRLYGREAAAKSEARWQALASDLDMDQLKGILVDTGKGFRLTFAREHEFQVTDTSEVIDVALAMARAWPNGLDAVGEVMAASGRGMDDPYLWAAMGFLSTRLPDADSDAVAWTGLVRSKTGVSSAIRQVAVAAARAQAQAKNKQRTLFDLVDFDQKGGDK
jgi:adenine-specific DNA methylase